MDKLIIPEQLESLLLKNWANFVDKTKLIKRVLQDARDADLKTSTESASATQLKITLTKFEILDNSKFEIWAEFSVPGQDATIVGSHIYHVDLLGFFELQKTFGMKFKNQITSYRIMD
jgi:hypothetical protein